MILFLVSVGSVVLNVLMIVAAQPLQYFYTASTVTGEHSLGGGCLQRDWAGVDSEGLTGHPWVSNIVCGEGSYTLVGVNYGGPIQVWVQTGSLVINGKALDMIGSSAWLNVGSEVSMKVMSDSSVWVVGAQLDVREGKMPHFVNFG